MKMNIATRIVAGIGLYILLMAISLEAYFYFSRVVPAMASLAEGLDLRFPDLAQFVFAFWRMLGWPVLFISPVLLGVGALPERVFLRVSIIVALVLVATQILLSCFFIYMQALGQTWWVLALQKVGSNG